MVEITINTFFYGVLTLIVGLAVSLLLSPSKSKSAEAKEIKETTAAFDDLLKTSGDDDWLSDDEDENIPDLIKRPSDDDSDSDTEWDEDEYPD